MAELNHLEILNQGVDVWNTWRRQNPSVHPNLHSAELGMMYSDSRLATYYRTEMPGVNLARAILIRADLYGADLRGADFSGADLRKTNFLAAELNGADFSHAHLFETQFLDCDLSGAKGLETCLHEGPSMIDHSTLGRSGALPLPFLRGCGLPNAFIDYLPSLLEKPLQFYKCFISYSEPDEFFSERLYNDLQSGGIRCWRWREDARMGHDLMQSIDSAIRFYDKLIVICSKDSLKSPAVLREIERALQKEDGLRREGSRSEVLFPIRLDEYVFDGWQHHRRSDLIAKYVGDFTDWRNPTEYRKMLDRLVDNLRAHNDGV